MKTFLRLIKLLFYCVVILSFFGCSSDSERNYNSLSYPLQKAGTVIFCDAFADAYESIYKQYHNNNDSLFSISIVTSWVEGMALDTDFIVDLQESHIEITEKDIEDLFNQDFSLEYYANNFLGIEAKNIFIPFINNIKNMTMVDRYSHIVYFEQTIENIEKLSESDIRLMLMAVSIIKIHMDNGDDDWADNGGTIIKAILSGGHENTINALIMAVVVRLIQENVRDIT